MIFIGRVAFIVVELSIYIVSFPCANAKVAFIGILANVAFIIPVSFPPIISPSPYVNALLNPKIPIAKIATRKVVVRTIFIKKIKVV
jgi:hypothetical protein